MKRYGISLALGAFLGFVLWAVARPNPQAPDVPTPSDKAGEHGALSTHGFRPLAHAAAGNEPEDERIARLTEVLCRWVRIDGTSALEWAASHLDSAAQEAVLADVLATWTWQDPRSMLEWFREGYLPDEFRHSRVHVVGPHGESIGTLVTEWLALSDPVMAAEFVLEDLYQYKTNITCSGTGEALVAVLTNSADHRTICETLLPFYEEHGRHLSEAHHVLVSWSAIDSTSANAFLETHPQKEIGIDDAAAQQVYASSPTKRSATADAQLAAAPIEDRASVMETMISAWALQDAAAAMTWLSEQKDASQTHPARAVMATRLAEQNPQDGIAYLQTLPHGTLRESTLETIIEGWAENALSDTLAYIESQALTWPRERQERLYQLAITVPGAKD